MQWSGQWDWNWNNNNNNNKTNTDTDTDTDTDNTTHQRRSNQATDLGKCRLKVHTHCVTWQFARHFGCSPSIPKLSLWFRVQVHNWQQLCVISSADFPAIIRPRWIRAHYTRLTDVLLLLFYILLLWWRLFSPDAKGVSLNDGASFIWLS